MSKITDFFMPKTGSDSGKRSNASSISDSSNNDNKEEEEPPPKRSLKSTSSEAAVACTSSKKSSVSSEDVERLINDLFTEDQKKVLHHYHRSRERNCSGLRKDKRERLTSKKDKFQHE